MRTHRGLAVRRFSLPRSLSLYLSLPLSLYLFLALSLSLSLALSLALSLFPHIGVRVVLPLGNELDPGRTLPRHIRGTSKPVKARF